jgi:CRP/FNR family cyclic AMP-dependent transcriptional regulator
MEIRPWIATMHSMSSVTVPFADASGPTPAARLPGGRWYLAEGGPPRRYESLVDLDPDFGRGLPTAELEALRRQLRVRVERIDRGAWCPRPDPRERPLGYLVLDGVLMRSRRVGDRWSTELLGAEDVLQPWADSQPPSGMTVETTWRAIERVEIALLDRRFALAAARWPVLLEELLGRALRRSRLLATLLSVSSIRRLDDRVIVLLRLLADRWGYVTPDGIVLRIRLTHETIARLACAQRPSVSTAISRLTRAGQIRRQGRLLVLPADAPEHVQAEIMSRRVA